jgi:hypothetical protein
MNDLEIGSAHMLALARSVVIAISPSPELNRLKASLALLMGLDVRSTFYADVAPADSSAKGQQAFPTL